ncbi:MAG: hypothetical protein NTZ14_16495 [Hyphomicrobiales bacterium]|nr:hypothetical protein [Hyphomicrobiales bacterium]
MARRFAGLLTLALIAGAPEITKAQDAEFGCKALLCAAASNPSWPQIPYCVPVMNQLYRMMRSLRFRWPVCTQARAGAPGYEPYQPCPAGWAPASSGNGEDSNPWIAKGAGDLCTRPASLPPLGTPIPAQLRCATSEGSAGTGMAIASMTCIEVMARSVNERPYSVEIDGQRVWFSLR